MKITHNIPVERASATVSAEYQAEVDASMRRGRLRWESEQSSLAAAERRRDRVARRKPKTARAKKLQTRQLRELDELIELRRMEVQRMAGLMQASPQSASHRGRKSFRPVPKMGDLL